MFKKLFGGDNKPKISPEEAKNIERKKNELKVQETIDKLNGQLNQIEAKTAVVDGKIADLTRQALAAKKAGQKDKAMRYLTQIKMHKNDLVKLSGYSTVITKQIASIESAKTDTQVADTMRLANTAIEHFNKEQEGNMEVFQDNAQLNDEFESNQEQINDILKAQTEKITDGLDEEYGKLDELEILDAAKDFDVKKDVKTDPAKNKVTDKKKDNFQSLVDDLLN